MEGVSSRLRWLIWLCFSKQEFGYAFSKRVKSQYFPSSRPSTLARDNNIVAHVEFRSYRHSVCSIFLPFVGSLSCPGFDLFILLYARLTNAGPKLCDCRADRKPCRGWAGYWSPVSTARGAAHQRGRAGRVVGQIFSHFSIFI
jgi:hypothetical protein